MNRVLKCLEAEADHIHPSACLVAQTPLLRDTSEVRGVSNLVVRFVADNPGE